MNNSIHKKTKTRKRDSARTFPQLSKPLFPPRSRHNTLQKLEKRKKKKERKHPLSQDHRRQLRLEIALGYCLMSSICTGSQLHMKLPLAMCLASGIWPPMARVLLAEGGHPQAPAPPAPWGPVVLSCKVVPRIRPSPRKKRKEKSQR